MKKNFLVLIMMLMCFAWAGAVETQRFEAKIGDFTNLVVVDNINVEYVCNPDSAGLAVFRAVPSMANQIIFNNNGKGKLQINVGTDSVDKPNLPLIKVYSNYLQEATNDGDSLLLVSKVASGPVIKFRLSDNGRIKIKNVEAANLEIAIVTGHGDITVSGKSDHLAIRNVGTGTIHAEKVESKDVSCRLLGTGKVYCNVDGGILKIKGSGTGKVYYKGTPKEIKSLQLGTIKAIHLDD